MENPATWGPLERAINHALQQIAENDARPPSQRAIGGSRARQIADVVRMVLNCPSCKESPDGPPHFASPRCESGGHNHCSCDTCF